MKLAIIGSGISGLVCAHLLDREHDVTLFEANDYVGGHTHTVDVSLDDEKHSIDTGFIVFNDWTYPNFIELLKELGVGSEPTTMGFSVHCERSGIEYSGASLRTLFAQKSNLLRPSHYQMLRDILRFNRQLVERLDELPEEMTLGEFLTRYDYSQAFSERYLLPMGAAIWSCPMITFSEFPVRFIAEFYRNHGLLNIRDRPTWRVVRGGSRTYVNKIMERFSGRLLLNTPVESVLRDENSIRLQTHLGIEEYDEVIFACHSDQALRMLRQPSDVERTILGSFPYGKNIAVLHTDESLLPRRRSVWSSWNYRVRHLDVRPTVTYNMNILQGIKSRHTFCVTLNDTDSINPSRMLGTFQYSHPIFTVKRARMQRRHRELIRRSRSSYCGAYWGNGFHEDGVNSALKVCEAFGVKPGWKSDISSVAIVDGERAYV